MFVNKNEYEIIQKKANDSEYYREKSEEYLDKLSSKYNPYLDEVLKNNELILKKNREIRKLKNTVRNLERKLEEG